MSFLKSLVFILSLSSSVNLLYAQALYPPILPSENWHNEERELRYHPEGRDFVITNGNRRFTRALYGTHSAFRVEAGDLPEFALYMPGMGGNLKFGLIDAKGSKWLIKSENITARYRAGSMLYNITDPMLGNGYLEMSILALSKSEGLILKANFKNVGNNIKLFWAFGGATGKNFSRNGDMGPDPESVFYNHPENCKGNIYQIKKNSFTLAYGKDKTLIGSFPSDQLKISDAKKQNSPVEMDQSIGDEFPTITGKLNVVNDKDFYFFIQNPKDEQSPASWSVVDQFNQAEVARKTIANRIIVNTPDPYINTIGGTLAIASDAIWEDPSYLHGAIGWRSRLNGWRGAYTADPLGWHDRARMHFNAYAKSQIIEPLNGPVVADTLLNLARSKEELGTAMFSSGYIGREPNGKTNKPHHYDMNLVFIDQLLWHLNWTGDLKYAKEMWPLLTRHLAWEKRVYDPDNDGLYDAYAVIWASDALQYSGGSVTHSSAYNYRSNAIAAKIARLINEDPNPYQLEADKILKAINAQLWMPEKGWFAEYRDAMGLKLLHPSAALWTIYHAIDSDVPDPFQAWQSLRYTDTELPHIAIRAKGLVDKGYYTVATTNWMPYEWSLNNVVLAESTHTALANWQSGRSEEAFKLWKSEMLASMYLGGSPGNFVQISHYDTNRGEAYRDFGDPIGINSRALVEGLFGIVPDALNKRLNIRPGLPANWDHASITIPDLDYSFERVGDQDTYTLLSRFDIPLNLAMKFRVRKNGIKSILVNGLPVKWKNNNPAIGYPEIEIESPAAKKYVVKIIWQGQTFAQPKIQTSYFKGENIEANFVNSSIIKTFDPQNTLSKISIVGGVLKANLVGAIGNRTVFVQVKHGQFTYWFPLCFELKSNEPIAVPLDMYSDKWKGQNFEKQNLTTYFNDKVDQIFKNKYLSPRPKTTTLQLPVQGIGDWPHPNLKPEINDTGLRNLARTKNEISLPSGIIFNTAGEKNDKNILFTSRWDNYPSSADITLTGKASAIFFLLAGSTNPMQSRMDNGLITVFYTDGTNEKLPLKNPENWWPIEKNLLIDGAAFDTKAPKPVRIHLKTGIIEDKNNSQWNGKEIDGGVATAIGLALNANKTLLKVNLSTLCNDVVIGVMGITLQR
ncbi:DUF4450 domain-containing protein [Pedobacter mucosus]|uniref:DUF4450 domain-containing protein n=1 Tax=Pedobacter mucosus TaxID=2895286 RepID=UPI001EE426EE|nr:DUF4450 domain-containing protein [Pedobacter mucosus]UKT65200.1 DUF4450 domain-containing protein [Pedobacter mucosus]